MVIYCNLGYFHSLFKSIGAMRESILFSNGVKVALGFAIVPPAILAMTGIFLFCRNTFLRHALFFVILAKPRGIIMRFLRLSKKVGETFNPYQVLVRI